MKKEIHPQYFSDTAFKCACGHTQTVCSTVKSIDTEICAKCHPFFTGKQKLVDTAGRVERFRKRAEKAAVKSKA